MAETETHTEKHNRQEHHSSSHRHKYRSSGKHSKDNIEYYKHRALSAQQRRKIMSKILFVLLSIVAIIVVAICIYVYTA